jgi:hypothetical protein
LDPDGHQAEASTHEALLVALLRATAEAIAEPTVEAMEGEAGDGAGDAVSKTEIACSALLVVAACNCNGITISDA